MNTLRSKRFTIAAAVAASLLAGCAAEKPAFRSNYDKSADFTAYHTYGFAAQPGTNRAGQPTWLTKQFEEAIRHEMDTRGYRYSDSDADLLVNFNADSQDRVDPEATPTTAPMPPPGGYYYGYRGDLYTAWPAAPAESELKEGHYEVGTANIDVADARKKQLLWEGVAEGKLTQKAMAEPEKAISLVVSELFAQFPGRVTP